MSEITTTVRRPTEFGRTQPPNEDWLRKEVPEDVIDPAIPIIDTHVHLWHHASGYRYFVPEFAQDLQASGHDIEASVYVECGSMYRATGPTLMRPVGETEFAVGMAAMAASQKYTQTQVAAAIIGFADLRDPEVDQLLAAHREAANGRFRGVRQRAKWDPDPAVRGPVSADAPGLYLDPDFQSGAALLAEYGLPFEASIFHPQVRDVYELAKAVPELSIVLGHTGSPVAHSSYAGRRSEALATWYADMDLLAQCPNVTVKIGGLLMSQGTFDFGLADSPPSSELLAELWRPFIEGSVERFGAKRCMVGSNFPVEKAGCSYRTIWNAFKRVLSGYSPSEKVAVFSGTGRRVYAI